MYYNGFSAVKPLPEPLSEVEFKFYMEKMKQGEISYREKIILHNLRLVVREVNGKFFNVPFEKDELIAVGAYGLLKAIDTFDISRGYKFVTYAVRCIDNEILMFMRKESKYVDLDSLSKVLSEDNGNILTLGDVISDNDMDLIDDYIKSETILEIREVVEDLNERDKEIIKLFFGFYDDKRYNQEEIGKLFNLSQSYVSRLLDKILFNIRKKMIKRGFVEERNIKNKLVKTKKMAKKSL